MPRGQMALVLEYLRALVSPAAVEQTSDAQLLERFLAHHDEAAFAALVQRFGPLVLRVCSRVLADEHAVEDAFQATFLILVRRARSIRKRRALGSWLYGVAYRVAARARAEAGRRRAPERELPARAAADPLDEVSRRDLRAVLDQELSRLPAKYREPLVLCYLEGMTTEEAARELGWPQGTVFTRLARGRDRLRARLVRRGVTLAAPALAAALSEEATAAVPAALLGAALRAGPLVAAGNAAAGGAVSARAAALTEGVLRAMFMRKLLTVAAGLLAILVLGTAGTTLAYHRLAGVPPAPAREDLSTGAAPARQPSDQDSGDVRTEEASENQAPGQVPGGAPGTSLAPWGSGAPGASGFGCRGGWGGFGGGFGGGGGGGGGFGGGGGGGSGFGGGFGGWGGGDGGSFGSCKLAPLTQKAVQQELKLTREQQKKLQDLQARQQEGLRRVIAGLRPETFLQDADALQKKLEELGTKAEKAVDDLLTGDQRARLKEISLQQRGGHALTDAEVAEALQLTEEQRQKVQAIQADAAKEMQGLGAREMQGLFQSPSPVAMQNAYQRIAKKMEEITKDTGDKLLDLLTTDQKAKWKELTGKPFQSAKP
jgi:RNA polymerase sigma factor (sigma-70 family)